MAAGILCACSGVAAAQPERALIDPDAPAGVIWSEAAGEQEGDRVRIGLSPGFEYQGSAGLQGGGDVSVVRGGIDLSLEIDLDPRWTFQLDVQNEWSRYDFEDAGWLPEGDDLDDAMTMLQISPGVRYAINDQWMAFGGLTYRFAGTTDADFGDASTGGGWIGARWQVNPRLSITGGVTVETELEDDLSVLPIIAIEYAISDAWSVSTRGLGVEVAYRPTDAWSVAVFAEYGSREYRLDDDHRTAPGGVFSERRVLVGLEAEWRVLPNISVTGVVGGVFGQKFELHDRDDDEISDANADVSLFAGIGIEFAF